MSDEKKQKYVVAEGCSFVGRKRTYVAGDEIDESAFSKPEHFKKMIDGDKPKIIPESLYNKKKSSGNEKPKEKDEDENLDGVDVTKIKNKPDREALKKLILEKGLLKEEKIDKFTDENLLKFAVKKGLVKE